ncbi:MAG: exodeoxyribonuclease VII small subunit [Candidatus Omnitrophica bacterium]|nr:exodeoxyribonuclease VII small subunit [Candidatus Omnitrophota bacterium]
MADISFEKAMGKLDTIVSELEGGDFALESLIKKYEEGIKLVELCRGHLDKAKSRIELIKKDKKGDFVSKDF